MLTTLSILSRDQGKLCAKPQSEDQYYARFGADAAPASTAPVRAGRRIARLFAMLAGLSTGRAA